MLAPVRVTLPAETPVSLDEVKAHLKVEHTDDDTYLRALIQVVTDHLDGYSGILGRALVTQSWRMDLRRFPGDRELRFPLLPVQSISAVNYWDALNADQTLDASAYSLYVNSFGPVLLFNGGTQWPGLYSRADAVRVTFVAGYGTPNDVPAPIKHAMLLMIGDLYASRGEKIRGDSMVEPAIDALLAPFRVRRI